LYEYVVVWPPTVWLTVFPFASYWYDAFPAVSIRFMLS